MATPPRQTTMFASAWKIPEYRAYPAPNVQTNVSYVLSKFKQAFEAKR
jgi:hypothetical protein